MTWASCIRYLGLVVEGKVCVALMTLDPEARYVSLQHVDPLWEMPQKRTAPSRSRPLRFIQQYLRPPSLHLEVPAWVSQLQKKSERCGSQSGTGRITWRVGYPGSAALRRDFQRVDRFWGVGRRAYRRPERFKGDTRV